MSYEGGTQGPQGPTGATGTGNPSTWSEYLATQDVGLSGYGITGASYYGWTGISSTLTAAQGIIPPFTDVMTWPGILTVNDTITTNTLIVNTQASLAQILDNTNSTGTSNQILTASPSGNGVYWVNPPITSYSILGSSLSWIPNPDGTYTAIYSNGSFSPLSIPICTLINGDISVCQSAWIISTVSGNASLTITVASDPTVVSVAPYTIGVIVKY